MKGSSTQLLFTLLLVVVCLFVACDSDNTMRDVEGNVYKTVRIGNQVWMAENLRVSHFKNGDLIKNVQANSAWNQSDSAAYCTYSNSNTYDKIYGKLYNWHCINDERGLAPKGWHIPSETEIVELIEFLASDTSAASLMKEAGTSHWLTYAEDSSKDIGFNALPAGYRMDDGSFHTLKSNAYFWTETASYEMFHWSSRLYRGFADVKREPYYMKYGLAIRCIKDAP